MKQLIKDVLVKNRHDLAKAYADDLDIDAEFDYIAGEIEQALQQCSVSGSLPLSNGQKLINAFEELERLGAIEQWKEENPALLKKVQKLINGNDR